MLIYFSVISILIIINQFLIYTKLQDLEERMKLMLKNDEHFQKWCSDVVKYFSKRR